MRFHADLHIHSKYSRATSRDCDLEHLAYWARRKGIAVVGTGDFTHPAWIAELKQKLVPAEPGFFRLQADIERAVDATLPPACGGETRFMLSVEISTIYKKGDLTRKIHHLIYVPDFDAADRFAAKLARIGNIASDGRPILGLDSRHLLEIALESNPDAYLVPAHIWTPWFAVLGSRSGFDSVAECYGDLADHIFAVETGLSSDPAMNWRISSLDRYRLVSNSDAHSPPKLGREATLFDTDLDYFSLRRALETGDGYVGTVEFFPEEGKYHLDGHRKCGIRLSPVETKALGGRCPACGQPVTVGVMHRVDALADRHESEATPPATAGHVCSLVPLQEILSEITASGPSSQTVERVYDRLLASLGAELPILESIPIEDIARADSSLLAEGIARLRAGKVVREAGYDGEYGIIRLFELAELKRHTAGGLLFDFPKANTGSRDEPLTPSLSRSAGEGTPLRDPPSIAPSPAKPERDRERADPTTSATDILAGLDANQRAAASIVHGPLLIVAGPGSGKTRTLTHRIAHLVADGSAAPETCLAITFTRRAAAEMQQRLAMLLPEHAACIPIHTFHSLGLSILREHWNAAGLQRGFRIADENERGAMMAVAMNVSERKVRSLLQMISLAKRTRQPAAEESTAALAAYGRAMTLRNWIDFDDLVGLSLQLLEADAALATSYRDRFQWISVDEFQDVDDQQYALVKLMAPPDANLCVIGDPDQAIYGFRGADAACFDRFRRDYPLAAVAHLPRNYRSSGTIVSAATQVIQSAGSDTPAARIVRDMHEHITIHAAPSAEAEAEFVVHTIEKLIGGHSFFSIDSGRSEGGAPANLSFSDIAVLYRTDSQSKPLCEAFARSGMPHQRHSHERLTDRPGVRALLQRLADLPGDVSAGLRTAADQLSGEIDAAECQAALLQLLVVAQSSGSDRVRFDEMLCLATEADCWDARADRVSLLTLHAAKGLEFPVVFIVGLEDGILPLRWRDGATESELAEERRLFYVGMTRAEDRLFLTRAQKRLWRGDVRSLPPSSYLNDIESELLQHSRREPTRRKLADSQLQLL
jgi:DNA helicase II / ATP-dependent DNA helicase PcrA